MRNNDRQGGDRLHRRTLLMGLGSVALGSSACDRKHPHDGVFGITERLNQSVQRGLFSPGRVAREEPVEAVSPKGAFPSYFHADELPIAPEGWVLRIGGMVKRPLELTLDDLMKLTRTDMRVRHYCVEGWSAVASWHGVKLRDLAQLVGADENAKCVEFRSFDDGYYSSWDRESADHPQTLVAYAMNGERLTAEHGAPARLYGSVKLGYKGVKYLLEILYTPEPSGGFWENLGYEWYAGVLPSLRC